MTNKNKCLFWTSLWTHFDKKKAISLCKLFDIWPSFLLILCCLLLYINTRSVFYYFNSVKIFLILTWLSLFQSWSLIFSSSFFNQIQSQKSKSKLIFNQLFYLHLYYENWLCSTFFNNEKEEEEKECHLNVTRFLMTCFCLK